MYSELYRLVKRPTILIERVFKNYQLDFFKAYLRIGITCWTIHFQTSFLFYINHIKTSSIGCEETELGIYRTCQLRYVVTKNTKAFVSV